MIYDSETNIPDETNISDEDLKLFKDLKMLHFWLKDYRKTVKDISNGIFTNEKLISQNPLCNPIQKLEVNLRHLTWQVKRIAEGDYSQKTYFMGAFSDYFNRMTDQLRERKIKLDELLKVSAENQNLHDANEMYINVMNQISGFIFIISKDNELIYSNTDKFGAGSYEKKICECVLKKIIDTDINSKQWEVFLESEKRYFNISSFKSSLNHEDVYVHIAEDITFERLKEKSLEEKAYKDDFTGIYNRRYFLMEMKDWASKEIKFTLCFFDLDNLKYINDNFGHIYGDSYIKEVVSIVSNSVSEDDIFARLGGDEFAILFKNCDEKSADKKMEFCSTFTDTHFRDISEHPRGFSYGLFEMDYSKEVNIEMALNTADTLMYKNKNQRRKNIQRQYELKN